MRGKQRAILIRLIRGIVNDVLTGMSVDIDAMLRQ
jgi:hypothetical protein